MVSKAIKSDSKSGTGLPLLVLGALGIVYGDIGTSPLYAFRLCFHGSHAFPPEAENILGALSLIFWSLILVISVKYLVLILRADNYGEGGTLALMALAGLSKGKTRLVLVLGLTGAALLYGDGIITPAISVLSAVEGMKLVSMDFEPYVIPITIGILVALFSIQRFGTGKIGWIFGPVIFTWFLVLGVLGIGGILKAPHVLHAVIPIHALCFFLNNGWAGAVALSAVFLVVTGGEALYADLGHFGKKPIRMAWFAVVLPGLLLNYFGQGALLLNEPTAAVNPFFLLAPSWGLYPLVVLATLSTIIASQAVIAGVFSLTRQAMQMDCLPRIGIVHTSQDEIGRVYIPTVNVLLLAATVALVLIFRSSGSLAAAYGLAVSATMLITTWLACLVASRAWHWTPAKIFVIFGFFLLIDAVFFMTNVAKIGHGGWVPLAIGAVLYVLMSTWREGRQWVMHRQKVTETRSESFLDQIEKKAIQRVPGSAVYLAEREEDFPPHLFHNIKHNKVLHEKIVVLTLVTRDIPVVQANHRWKISMLPGGLYRCTAYYGFKEIPNIPRLLQQGELPEYTLDTGNVTYFLGRIVLIPRRAGGVFYWRKKLYVLMKQNAQGTLRFFRIPPEQVLEVGMQLEI